MIRLGASSQYMKNMSKYDVFSSRLQLLIIMTRAYLKGYPIGEHRKEAVLKNAKDVFYMSLAIASESDDWCGHIMNFQPDENPGQEMRFEDVFHQRVQLLTMMATNFANNGSTGNFQKKATEENIHFLCEAITFNSQLGDIEFLKVA